MHQIIRLIVEANLPDLVDSMVVNDGIFTGWSPVRESITEIQTHNRILHHSGETCPIPGVLVGPTPSTPIENSPRFTKKQLFLFHTSSYGSGYTLSISFFVKFNILSLILPVR